MEYSKKIYSLEEKKTLLRSKKFYQSVIQSNMSKFEQGQLVDELLGLESFEIENKLTTLAKMQYPNGNFKTWGEQIYRGHQTWVGLDPQELQTPLSELLEILELVDLKNKRLLDLGCGFGRPGMIFSLLEPTFSYKGVDLVQERINSGKKVIETFELKNIELICGDLFDNFMNEKFNILFIYDFGNLSLMDRFLELLSEMKHSFDFIVRGRGMRHLIHNKHLWLETSDQIIHRENFSIYQKNY